VIFIERMILGLLLHHKCSYNPITRSNIGIIPKNAIYLSKRMDWILISQEFIEEGSELRVLISANEIIIEKSSFQLLYLLVSSQ
jgi:hypothetical protein